MKTTYPEPVYSPTGDAFLDPMTLVQRTFPLNTDCVEFCRVRGFENLLAVGCYELDLQTNDRQGQIHILCLKHEDHHTSLQTNCSNTCLPGVLDLKWCPVSLQRCELSAATADGQLYLFNVPYTYHTSKSFKSRRFRKAICAWRTVSPSQAL